MWSKHYQHVVQTLIEYCMGDFRLRNVSISNGNIKYPIGKSFFTVNLPLKLFRATVAKAGIESIKSLHTFLKKMFVPLASEFEQIRMVKTTRNFELFDKKNCFFRPF